MEHSSAQEFPSAVPVKISKQRTSTTKQCIIRGKLVVDHTAGQSCPGKSASVRIYSCAVQQMRKGKFSAKAYLRHGKRKKHNGTETTTYAVKLKADPDLGIPGALVTTNKHKHKFFLQSA